MIKEVLPALPKYDKSRKFVFPVTNIHGKKLKIFCRDLLKGTKIYHRKIVLDDPNVKGRNAQGDDLSIKYLGAWAFGAPGFQGRLKFYPDRKQITVKIPDDEIPLIDDLIQILGNMLVR